MKEATSREKILKKIRKALIQPGDASYLNADFESELFVSSNETPEILFANKFSELNGKFVFCTDENDLIHSLQDLFSSQKWNEATFKEEEIFYFLEKTGIKKTEETDSSKFCIAVTMCECLIASTGSVFVSAKQGAGRKFFVNNDVHIVIAFTSQVVKDLKEGFEFVKTKYDGRLPSLLTLVSGPSKTADIEQTLVYGAHGPKELYCFLVEG